MEKLFICKAAGQKKDAIRVNRTSDIPEFLKKNIDIAGEKLYLKCVEGDETAPIGSVIGYEETESLDTGWNVWCIGNADTNLIEREGEFYTKPTPLRAEPVGEAIPDFLEGAPIKRQEDGSWELTTDWGVSKGFPGKAYWVLYGNKEDGSPDANILTKTEKSYQEYFLCDQDGNIEGALSEIDPA